MSQKSRNKNGKVGFIVGRTAFAKISAVEGIGLTSDMVRDLKAFDAAHVPNAQRRAAIKVKYGRPQTD